jgi:hypothetical protein
LKKSPLDDSVDLNDRTLTEIEEVDGIKSYRVCKQILKLKKEGGRSQRILLLGLTAILIFLSLEYWQVISGQLSFVLTALSAIASIVGYLAPSVRRWWKRS